MPADDTVWHRASPTNFYASYQTGTCYLSSWSLSTIIASLYCLRSKIYDVWEMASPEIGPGNPLIQHLLGWFTNNNF